MEVLQISLVKENKFFIFVVHKCIRVYPASTKSMLKCVGNCYDYKNYY